MTRRIAVALTRAAAIRRLEDLSGRGFNRGWRVRPVGSWLWTPHSPNSAADGRSSSASRVVTYGRPRVGSWEGVGNITAGISRAATTNSRRRIWGTP